MTAAENLLIASLPRKVRTDLLAVCELVPLASDQLLCQQGARLQAVYFPTDGAISLLTCLPGEADVEVAMVGREGMLGAHCALGIREAPLRAVVSCSGLAWRLSSAAFRMALKRNAAVERCCWRYLHLAMCQLATSVACQRLHTIGPRLARLLLMLCDRTGTGSLHVTHESLALLLGVRRVGITMAAGDLHRSGLITYHRGELSVLDRPGLEAAACSCYAANLLLQAHWLQATAGIKPWHRRPLRRSQ
ncbi:Crp/Fnr family transcriptional regulator [Sphaerotilus microaerophilus]|uniref:Crp/Fnr family transcriptional regulator n=1 Tax=Sphaerotilus microaerophilus TaxID=2914710 RepID=A0ABN6PPP7_9BURK|nr:Crp/Fnr family transcriptional regulator [Sphaerotilus sp. FB-5]BDI05126.1 hypothetical protein CATMQ487_20960 [Sphaerotilus sp. FB-5]